MNYSTTSIQARNTRSQTRHRNLSRASNHMISYQQRLQDFRNNTTSQAATSIAWFKRHNDVSPDETNYSARKDPVSMKRRKYNHRTNPLFLLSLHN